MPSYKETVNTVYTTPPIPIENGTQLYLRSKGINMPIVATITGVNTVNCNVSDYVTESGGNENQVNSIRMQGRVPYNKFHKIATIKLELSRAIDSFTTAPSLLPEDLLAIPDLDVRNTLKMDIGKITKNNDGRIVAYEYDLKYKSDRSIGPAENLKFSITPNNHVAETRSLNFDTGSGLDTGWEVERIAVGSSTLSANSENRILRIFGVKGREFVVEVNKLTEYVDALDNVVNTLEESALNDANSNAGYTNDENTNLGVIESPDGVLFKDGRKMKAFRGIMPESGFIDLHQRFPETSAEQKYIVRLHSILRNEAIGKALDISDEWWLTIPIPGIGFYDAMKEEHILTQFKRDILTTLRFTIDYPGRNHTVKYDTSITGVLFNAANPLDHWKFEKGVANKQGDKFERFTNVTTKLDFTVEVTTDGTVSAKGGGSIIPVWSNTDSTVSDWTNSIPDNNGGTKIKMHSLTGVISGGNHVYTITGTAVLDSWGTKDTIMVCNLNELITIS